MKTSIRLFALAGISFALIVSSTPSARTQNKPAVSAATREEAYRANNLGVALLEQFNHKEGAESFRRALKLDPQLNLARINLAIALFNVPDLPEALAVAQSAAAAAPNAPQPQYILGLIARTQNRADDAAAAFQRVLKIDPRDTGANVNLGQLYAQQRKYAEAIAAFRVALDAEPYNGTALYNLATASLRGGEREEGQRLIQRFQALRQSGAATVIGQNYLEQGRYAEAVASTGTEAGLVDPATPDVAFRDATASVLPATLSPAKPDVAIANSSNAFGRAFAPGELNDKTARELALALGGGATLFDFDNDGDLDLLRLLANGQRLYRNDGGKYADVTDKSGALGADSANVSIGAVAGDYDNDTRPDIFILRGGSLALYHNDGDGKFSDVTAAAAIPAYPFLSISAALVDVDHDGDLDIFIAGLADIAKTIGSEAKTSLNFPNGFAAAPNMLLRNNGDGKFTDITAAANVAGTTGGHAVAVVPTDYDNRRDVDLLVLNYDTPPVLFRNLRDTTFRDVASNIGLDVRGDFTAAAAGDVNKDDFTDFFFASAGARGVFAMSDGQGRFNIVPAPPTTGAIHAAQFLDYDNDGVLDLVAQARDGVRVWRNLGNSWEDVSERAVARAAAAGDSNAPAASTGAPSRVLAAGDVDADGDDDLVTRAADGELRFMRNDGGSNNRSVNVRLAGKVSNRSGIGAKIEARAGSLRQKFETYAATPAPAPADVIFGLGKRTTTDAVRVLWPAGIVQAETEITPAATVAARTGDAKPAPPVAVRLTVTELDRKPSSCPYLFAWNGERFEFITDFMGGGELGYWVAPGVRAAPDPDEYVRIRGDQLRPRNGLYELRVTNELEEALFMDHLKLVAVAHPRGVEVYPNEGLGNPTAAKFKLYTTRDARPPVAATDDDGSDVLARITQMDRKYPDNFRLHRIRGYADSHTLTLDLGKTDGKQTLLLLTGWTDYAFSSDNVAAAQSGMSLKLPSLQVRDAQGKWQTVMEDIGVPVGRPQTVTVDLAGKFLSASREVRIVTNMRIYWDQILVDTSNGDAPVKLSSLAPARADLNWRGFSAEATPDGREPFGYTYANVSAESPWKVFPGRYTREGDVRELLAGVDDMFVVSRPGDEIALSFSAHRLPPLPEGWTRTFLLYADGYSKEMDINSSSPDRVGQLPFHGMKNYPYAAPEAYPSTPAHRAYVERYNTRIVAAPVPQLVNRESLTVNR